MMCVECDFYHTVDDSSGECREKPPRVFLVPVRTIGGDGVGFSTNFPVVKPDGWCGSYSSRLPVTDKPVVDNH